MKDEFDVKAEVCTAFYAENNQKIFTISSTYHNNHNNNNNDNKNIEPQKPKLNFRFDWFILFLMAIVEWEDW